jgi:hypothetical protein
MGSPDTSKRAVQEHALEYDPNDEKTLYGCAEPRRAPARPTSGVIRLATDLLYR